MVQLLELAAVALGAKPPLEVEREVVAALGAVLSHAETPETRVPRAPAVLAHFASPMGNQRYALQPVRPVLTARAAAVRR